MAVKTLLYYIISPNQGSVYLLVEQTSCFLRHWCAWVRLQLSGFNLGSRAERSTRSPAPSWWPMRTSPAALSWSGFSSLRPPLTGTHSRAAASTPLIHDRERRGMPGSRSGTEDGTRHLSWGTEICCCPCTDSEPGWSLTWGSSSSSWRSSVLLSSGWLGHSDYSPGILTVSWEQQEGPERRQEMRIHWVWRRSDGLRVYSSPQPFINIHPSSLWVRVDHLAQKLPAHMKISPENCATNYQTGPDWVKHGYILFHPFYLNHFLIGDEHDSVPKISVSPALHVIRPFAKQHWRRHQHGTQYTHSEPLIPFYSLCLHLDSINDLCPPGKWSEIRRMFLDPGEMQPFDGNSMKTPERPLGFSSRRSPETVANLQIRFGINRTTGQQTDLGFGGVQGRRHEVIRKVCDHSPWSGQLVLDQR